MNIFKFLKEKIIKSKPEPVTITDEESGTFTLDNYGWFTNDVDWLGEECSVSLRYDEKSENSAEQALAAFKKIYSDRKSWDERLRRFAAECLTDNANDWLEQSDEEDIKEITKEQFAARISLVSMWVYADGSYLAFFDDDNMFYEHTVVVDGNINGEMKRADIWG